MNIKPHYYVTLVPARRKTFQTTEVQVLRFPERGKKLSQLDVAISCLVPAPVLRRALELDPDAKEAIFRHLLLEVTGLLALHPDEFMVHYDSLGYGIFMEFLDMSPSDRTRSFQLYHKTGKLDPRVIRWEILPMRFV